MATSRINMECKRYGCMKNLLACYANCRYNGRCDELKTEVVGRHEEATLDINNYLRERGRPPITIQVMKRGLRFAEAARQQPARKSSTDTPPRDEIAKPLASSQTGPSKAVASKEAKLPPARLRRKRAKRSKPTTRVVKAKATRPAPEPKREAIAKGVRSRQSISRLSAAAPVVSKRIKTKKERAPKMARKNASEESIKKQERAEASNLSGDGRDSVVEAKGARPNNGSRRKTKGSPKNVGHAKKNGKLFIILEGRSATLVDEQGLIAHLLGNNPSGARYFEASEVEARLQIVPKR